MDSIITIHTGEKIPGVFSAEEMARRLAALRAHMAGASLGAVLMTSHHNVKYYSDYLYTQFGRPYGLVVTEGDAILISANVDAGQPWRRAVGDTLTYTDWQRDNFYRAVERLIPDGGRVGIEHDHVSLDSLAKLEAALPRSAFVDVAEAAMRMRLVKSAEEIALIKEGARIADIGGAACVEALQIGVAEFEIARHATDAMVREIARAFPQTELMETWTWFQSGINTESAHNPLTTRRIARGDILSLNAFPMISGYYTALERTLFAEHCSEAHLRLWQANVEVHEAGIGLIGPGLRCCDIATELNKIYRAHDLLHYRTFGYGHSFGVLAHYYGREAGLELREDVETVLVPGMVLSMEPMISLPEGLPGAGGYREHDILVVTETGADNITGFPYGPEHNIIAK